MVSPELLRRYTFFAGFSDEELKRLAMAGDETTISEGEEIFTERDRAEALYFLVDGEVEILINTDEHGRASVPISTLPAGELIGWSALIEPKIFTATARATRPCRVIVFERAAIERLTVDAHFYGMLMHKVAQVISRRLKDTRIQLVGFAALAS